MSQAPRHKQNLYGESLKPDTIVRVHKHERNYLQVANTTVQDERLSWAARGLLVYLLSLPRDWRISVAHLQKQGGAGRDALRALLHELQEFGYASGVGRDSQKRGERGRFGQTEIAVYELPSLNLYFFAEDSPSPENPSTVNPSTDSPLTANPSAYKDSNPQKTRGTKAHTTQTGLRAVGAPAVVVGEGSKFSLEDCRRYANHLHASGQGVKNPGGFAKVIHQTGAEDPQIAMWLAQVDPERVESGELAAPTLTDVSACPDCEGRRWAYVDPQNYVKGMVRCKHPRLTNAA